MAAGRYADGVAFVMWTSGTTGRPKPIEHTHTAYLELLDRVLGPLRAGASVPATAGEAAEPQPHPGVDGAQRRVSTTCCSGSGPARSS